MKIGAKKMIIDDLRKEFITELCFPAVRKETLLHWFYDQLANFCLRVQCDLRGPISARCDLFYDRHPGTDLLT